MGQDLPDDDSGPDLVLERRRRQARRAKARRRLLTAAGCFLAAAVLAGVCVALAVSRVRDGGGVKEGVASRPLFGGPTPASEGETWDHNELAAYLRSRGVRVHSEPTERNSAWGPACEFRQTAERGPEVHVQKWPDRQTAKDRAAATPPPAFAWGRFVFSGEPGTERFVSDMKSALGVR